MQVNGTQLAAGCNDGTVIAWSYPKGEILFQMNEHKGVYGIKWNPLRQDVFATRHRVRNAVDSLFHCSIRLFRIFLFGGGRKVANNLILSTSLSFFSSFFISHFSEEIVFVEYASERRRHKGKSVSLIGTKCGYQESRVDFRKSNRSRVHE